MLWVQGGTPGPAGPIGPTGATGPTGPTGAAGLASVFVYRPGVGVTHPPNVFGSVGGQQDPALDAAIAATAGPVVLQVDDSIVSPAVIGTPATPWRTLGKRDVTIQGLSEINLATGLPGISAEFTGAPQGLAEVQNLLATIDVGVTLIAVNTNEEVIVRTREVIIAGAGTFVDATAAGATLAWFATNTEVIANTVALRVSASTGAPAGVNLLTSTFDGNNIVGPGAKVNIGQDGFSNLGAQAGITGTPTIRFAKASLLVADLGQSVTNATAQAAAASGDLFGASGTGVAYASKTGKVLVEFGVTGDMDAAGEFLNVDLAISGGSTLLGNTHFESNSSALGALRVACSGQTMTINVPVGSLINYRAVWTASAGTFAPRAAGNLVLKDVL